MPIRYRNGQYFALVALSKTNRRIGYLRPVDRKNSIDEMSKFGPSIVGFMPKTSVRSLYIALVLLSKTNRERRYLQAENS